MQDILAARVERQGGEMTLEETMRLESDLNHAVKTLGISDDYIGEMANHVIMVVGILGIRAASDAEDE